MTVMKRLPRNDTSHKGILSIKPTPSMALTISEGRVAVCVTAVPIPFITVATIPPQILNIAVIISMP